MIPGVISSILLMAGLQSSTNQDSVPVMDGLAPLHQGVATLDEWRQLCAVADEHQRTIGFSAALVPARVSSLTRSVPDLLPQAAVVFSGEQIAQARVRVRTHLLSRPDCPERDALLQRLRGWLVRADLIEALHTTEASQSVSTSDSPAVVIELLLLAPWSVAEEFLPIALTSTSFSREQRINILRHWLNGGGVDAFHRALELLDPIRDSFLLRPCLSEWENRMLPTDLPFFSGLTDAEDVSLAQTARLVWARHESNPAVRWLIFQDALELGDSMRDGVVRALARVGAHEGISSWLSQHLEADDELLRNFADHFLPHFLSPEKLYQEYAMRIGPSLSELGRARRMAALARLPQAYARNIAAEWLAGGGWAQGRIAVQVAKELSAAETIAPSLSQLFAVPGVPVAVVLPLARAQAEHMLSAREWLRQLIETGTEFEQGQAVRALAAAGDPADIQLLFALIQDHGFDSTARAVAGAALAKLELARPELLAWLMSTRTNHAMDYEVYEELVRSLIQCGAPEQRRAVLDYLAGDGTSELDGDIRTALRLVGLQAREVAPIATELPELDFELAAWLAALSSEDVFVGGLPDPRELSSEYPGVHRCSRALAATIRLATQENTQPPPPGSQPPRWTPALPAFAAAVEAACAGDANAAPISALLHAISVLPAGSCAQIARRLAEHPDMEASIRLRAKAQTVRHALQHSPAMGARWLRELLAAAPELRSYPWDLAYGLADRDAVAWVLPADRLADAYLLQSVGAVGVADRHRHLEALLIGYVPAEMLLRASHMTIPTAGGRALAKNLLQRAHDWSPTHDAITNRLNQFSPSSLNQ